MKLFGSFKLTDRIRIGASTGEGRKQNSSSKGSTGCGLIILALPVIYVPISLIKSCVGGDEKATATEATTIYVKTSDNTVISEEITVTVFEAETTAEAETTEKDTVAPVLAQKKTKSQYYGKAEK